MGNANGGALNWLTSGNGALRSPAMMGATGTSSRLGLGQSRYQAELAYGWPEDARMRDFYARATDSGLSGRQYSLGTRLTLGDLAMQLELTRQRGASAVPNHGLRLTFGAGGGASQPR